jgi:hypothetical protein
MIVDRQNPDWSSTPHMPTRCGRVLCPFLVPERSRPTFRAPRETSCKGTGVPPATTGRPTNFTAAMLL